MLTASTQARNLPRQRSRALYTVDVFRITCDHKSGSTTTSLKERNYNPRDLVLANAVAAVLRLQVHLWILWCPARGRRTYRVRSGGAEHEDRLTRRKIG